MAVIGVLLFFAFVICLIWGIVNLVRKKKAKKVFLISLASLVLCFVLALVDSSNDAEQAAEKEAQMQKEREARIEKKTAKTASAEVEKPTFPFVEASGIVYKMAGDTRSADVDDMTKAKFIKTSIMKGYLTTKMKDHVYMYADVDKSGEWIQATFDDKDNVVKKVEMSPNLEKKVVSIVNKEKAAETAKKEEVQKKADEQKQAEQKKQEEAKKLEDQKAKEEAQAKAAEEKRKQEEADRVAEEKRVAEQKQKEQEVEQASKEAEEEAQAQQQQQQTQPATFANCTEVRAAGRAPIRQGEPGFQAKFDRDGDGIGCDQ
ncbi:excalibur calcium-binding domain-containing protein [Priestia megaterium]|uniref:excalibur calcium-binding domain-containing protein n=1 Tax=Priestia megaterium TaxID=1404 RepID=UPI00244C27A7|nr:excalibur calcium-binding domain-containing protein [Priestia megaterium]MDH2452122.1 excalibur calcium-binding domain-containing protein [Priestia megaterium]MDL5151579.1 excalibur calcium-binding domain-containing protein [Priestia megaterium]